MTLQGNKMKIRTIALMTALVGSVAACSYVPAGNVGVKVNMLGGAKGVDTEILPVGKYWIG